MYLKLLPQHSLGLSTENHEQNHKNWYTKQ